MRKKNRNGYLVNLFDFLHRKYMPKQLAVLTCRENAGISRTVGNIPYNRVINKDGELTAPARPRWTRWSDIEVIDPKSPKNQELTLEPLNSSPKPKPKSPRKIRELYSKKDVEGAELMKDIQQSLTFITNFKEIRNPIEIPAYQILEKAYNMNTITTFNSGFKGLPPIHSPRHSHYIRTIGALCPEFEPGPSPPNSKYKAPNTKKPSTAPSPRTTRFKEKDISIRRKQTEMATRLLQREVEELQERIKANKEEQKYNKNNTHIFSTTSIDRDYEEDEYDNDDVYGDNVSESNDSLNMKSPPRMSEYANNNNNNNQDSEDNNNSNSL